MRLKLILATICLTISLIIMVACKSSQNSVFEDKNACSVDLKVWKLYVKNFIEDFKKDDRFHDVEIQFIELDGIIRLKSNKKEKDEACAQIKLATQFALEWGKKEENQVERYFDDGENDDGSYKYKKFMEDSVKIKKKK